MSTLKQITLLVFISFISEILTSFLPFIFPSSLMAMLVLFIFLITKKINVKNIEPVGNFLQQNIAIFFIPPAVSLIDEFPFIKDKVFILLFISFISFLVTFLVTAYTVNLVIKIQERFRKNERNIK